jgi:hypothetical protein
VGQVALTRRALPTIVPAHYLVHDDRVLVHMSTGLDCVPWIDGEIVAFHVSAFDDDSRYGWSVSVTGAAHGTPNPTGHEPVPHAPWIAHGGGDLIAISTDMISGERLGPIEGPNTAENATPSSANT